VSSALNRESEEHEMYATIRRYEGVDESGSVEITKKVNENLISRLSEQPRRSNRVAAKMVQDEDLQRVLPNPPKITLGKLMAHKLPELVGV
jgi:ribosomal protein L31E